MKDNIILIGMPGVGKSTAGVVAAKLAGYQFLDSDLVIMQRDGRLLPEIIQQDGVEGFLSIENRVNASISTHNTIIATGGSVVFGEGRGDTSPASERLCTSAPPTRPSPAASPTSKDAAWP